MTDPREIALLDRWITITADAAHYVDFGRDPIACDRLSRPIALILKNPVLCDGAFLPSAARVGLPHSLADRVGASATPLAVAEMVKGGRDG
jgi:hypothetical protein